MITYWNGETAEARRVTLVVADGPHPLGWYREHIGQRRDAVEVIYPPLSTFWLDDEDGNGWLKVTEGRGSPSWAHRSLYPEAGSVEAREAVA